MSRNAFTPSYARALAGALALCAALLAVQPAQAQERPRQGSSLYYRLGGGDPAARASNRSAVSARLGLSVALRLNYSCGKFDIGLTWQSLMDGFARLGTAITGAVRAGIAALPMYIFQRASPGLYQLFQTYSEKADAMIAASVKSCEEMEAQIKAGGDPYAEWLGMAKGERWRAEASLSGDIVNAKTSIETNGGLHGITWIGGERRGGQGQQSISLVRDLVTAGYNATLNQAVTSAESIDYSASGGYTAERLPRIFKRPQDAAAFATDVLGEMMIATCDDYDCPPKGTSTGLGLIPKFETESMLVQGTVNRLISAPIPAAGDLEAASAPGIAITRELIDAVNQLPAYERGIAAQRLGKEIALARIIEKALAVRNLLLTGTTLPEVAAGGPASKGADAKIAVLNRFIDDLMYEHRVRKEIVTDTATKLLEAYYASRAQSGALSTSAPVDTRRVNDGAVRP